MIFFTVLILIAASVPSLMLLDPVNLISFFFGFIIRTRFIIDHSRVVDFVLKSSGRLPVIHVAGNCSQNTTFSRDLNCSTFII
jgi:hypothetical protein